jgi:hypothetical protein
MTEPNDFDNQQIWAPSVADTHLFLQRTCAVIQALFAAFWAFRFGLAWDSVAMAVLLPLALLSTVLLLYFRVKLPIRRPGRDPISRSMVRQLNAMTAVQLAASCVLPFMVPSNWVLASIMVTIGLLLLGVFMVLRAPPLLVSGPLLVITPAVVALTIEPPDALVALIGAVCLTGSSLGMLIRLVLEQKSIRVQGSAA